MEEVGDREGVECHDGTMFNCTSHQRRRRVGSEFHEEENTKLEMEGPELVKVSRGTTREPKKGGKYQQRQKRKENQCHSNTTAILRSSLLSHYINNYNSCARSWLHIENSSSSFPYFFPSFHPTKSIL